MNRGKQHMDEELLIRFIIGETNDDESGVVEEWIDLSDDNKAEVEKLQKVWTVTANPRKIARADVNTDKAWANLKSRMDQYAEIESIHSPKQRSILFYLTRVAAVFVIGIMIFSIININLSN